MIYKVVNVEETRATHHCPFLETKDNEVQFFDIDFTSIWFTLEERDLDGMIPVDLTREEILLIELL